LNLKFQVSSFKFWLLAARPKTLVAAIVPVMVGTALASRYALIDWPVALHILFAAIFIQIGTNLSNDYGDHARGADTAARVGPVRVTQSGLIKSAHVRIGFMVAYALAVVIGIPLILRGGWPIFAIGALGILAGWAYTNGPYPLGYNGLGELFVLLFFGIIAVAGTSYLLVGEWLRESFWIGLAPGLHASAILVANNVRDIETDRAAGKRTLAATLGRKFGRLEFALFILIPFLIPVMLFFRGYDHRVLLPFLALPLTIRPLGIVWSKADPVSLIRALVATAILQLVFGLLFAIGLWQ
jgi:1,4-dihydroxy-2-naphthoate octaprenyltransferase